MIFYKKRNQAAVVWDPKAGRKGAAIAHFTRIKRDAMGIDGMLETEDPKLIKTLKKAGYAYEGEEVTVSRRKYTKKAEEAEED